MISIPVSITSVSGRPKDPRLRVLIVEQLQAAEPPMMNIPMIREAIRRNSGLTFSWNTVVRHLEDLAAEGIVKRLVYQRSRRHEVRYRTGRKAGTVETRTKTSAWYQLSERLRRVEGLDRT